jgi:uncharacterized protein (UPF0210 family)
MKIRALTGFLDPGWPFEPDRIKAMTKCLTACRNALGKAGYEVQSLRLATPPPAEMLQPVPPATRSEFARRLEAECFVHGIDYAAIGPALPEELEGYAFVPNILAATENIFTSGLYADPETGISLPAARACAHAIREASTITEDGFANLRFAALANVLAGSPFFPAAYHRGGTPSIALATESADLAVEAIQDASSMAVARRRLVSTIENHAAALNRIARSVAEKYEFQFYGTDFSLAPFPEDMRSIGTAIEAMGAAAAGLAGTAAVAAFLADCLDRAQFQRTGFCGLFLPVLEDSVLAAQAADGALTISDLLLYATLCGTGLDTVPLPGDTSADSMAALLVDLGALSLRHNKALTARLMPIPGKVAGDEIHFDFPYFADSRVMNFPAQPLTGLLADSGILDIGPRTP